MRVGVVAYLLHEGRDYRAAGVSTYLRNLLRHLPAAAPHDEVIPFTGSDAPVLGGLQMARLPFSTQRPLLRIPAEQLLIPLAATLSGVDVLHGAVNVLPVASRGPTVVTIHDLAFLRHPERFHRQKAHYLRFAVARSARRATRVIAVSRNTAQDMADLWGIGPERVDVVYPGVDDGFRELPSDRVDAFRAGLFGGRPFILHVGTLEPRKNLDVLIRAFVAARRRCDLPHVLALVGARGWMYETLFALAQELGMEDCVRFIEYVDPGQLPLWYNASDLFTYPSAYEGFGLPVLEAMACGAPVITSASSSLIELAGDACLTVEPGSEEELSVAIERVLGDAQLRARLRRAGAVRASAFSWQRTAADTMSVYRKAAGQFGT